MHAHSSSMAPRRLLRPAGLAGLAILAGVAGAAAWAAIPDRSGVIHACYNDRTGALRVVDSGVLGSIARPHCGAGETPLAWNQGGSSAISVHRADSGPISSPGAPWVPIITAANVPAGTYAVAAKTTVFDTETDGGDCQLVSGASAVVDGATHSPYKGASAGTGSTFNLEALVRLASPDRLQLQCRRGGPILRDWRARDSKIILIRLNSASAGASRLATVAPLA